MIDRLREFYGLTRMPFGRDGIITFVATVCGWIRESNLHELVQRIAAYVNYRWDHLDDDALIGTLDPTDADNPDTWFEYPIAGDPPVILALACELGTDQLDVCITGTLDPVLTARFETLLDVY